jgi:hypothetical protein
MPLRGAPVAWIASIAPIGEELIAIAIAIAIAIVVSATAHEKARSSGLSLLAP